jgi:long-subunit fatty acid transport protein
MKSIIILSIILLFNTLTAQQIAIGFDVSNAIQGSEVNVPSLDIQAKISDITDHREIGLAFEYFKEIDYFSMSMYANKIIPINNFRLLAGVEVVQIIRGKFTSFAYGFNGETRYFFTDKMAIGLQYNYRRRTDLQLLYNDGRFVGSGFINLIYKWK